MTQPERPAHLIRRRDVPAWLAGSVIREVTSHVTVPDEAARLISEGVRVDRSAVDTSWGRGFYSSLIPDWRYGTVAVRVAVRLLRPLVITDTLEGAALIDDLLRAAGTEDVRAAVEAAGHDSVVIHFHRHDLWAVAYRDEQVRIVHDG